MRPILCLNAALVAFGLLLPAATPSSAQQANLTYFPGAFAMRTPKGFYLTALSGGGRASAPVVVTSATKADAWEKFRLAVMSDQPTHDKVFQTMSGNFLTAVSGGGRTSDVLHTDATLARGWEQFRVLDLGANGGTAPTYFALQTLNGGYVTAVGQGGKYEDAIHTDARQIGSWEYLRLVKCGDLGDGYQYTIITPKDQVLTAVDGGGKDSGDTIVEGYWPGDTSDRAWARFKFIRQADGSYGLQTANGVNFLTALGGGGQVQKYLPPDCGFPGACISGTSTIFHTDATQVRGWEKFKFVDRGNCTYTIQTTSGFFMGIFQDSDGHWLMTTRRTQNTENESFQLVMYGLASPIVLH
jgi:hypothetical protein